MRIVDMVVRERPRERLIMCGVSALSDAELLSLVLRHGVGEENVLELSSRLLGRFGLHGLQHAMVQELCLVRGVGVAKASQLVALFELHRRVLREKAIVNVSNARDAYRYCVPLIGHLEQEHFLVVWLDVRNQVLGHEIISKGLVDGALVHAREVFRGAIKANASSVIVAHNHPSGDVTPSSEDLHVTHQLSDAGRLLGITVVDHLIVGRDKYERVIPEE